MYTFVSSLVPYLNHVKQPKLLKIPSLHWLQQLSIHPSSRPYSSQQKSKTLRSDNENFHQDIEKNMLHVNANFLFDQIIWSIHRLPLSKVGRQLELKLHTCCLARSSVFRNCNDPRMLHYLYATGIYVFISIFRTADSI